MTSNEDAEIRKHVYKPLKRRSPTPLYYPLAAARAAAGAGAAARRTSVIADKRHQFSTSLYRAPRRTMTSYSVGV